MSTKSHQQELARMLQHKLGVDYQKALLRVRTALEKGVLPSDYAGDLEAALRILLAKKPDSFHIPGWKLGNNTLMLGEGPKLASLMSHVVGEALGKGFCVIYIDQGAEMGDMEKSLSGVAASQGVEMRTLSFYQSGLEIYHARFQPGITYMPTYKSEHSSEEIESILYTVGSEITTRMEEHRQSPPILVVMTCAHSGVPWDGELDTVVKRGRGAGVSTIMSDWNMWNFGRGESWDLMDSMNDVIVLPLDKEDLAWFECEDLDWKDKGVYIQGKAAQTFMLA